MRDLGGKFSLECIKFSSFKLQISRLPTAIIEETYKSLQIERSDNIPNQTTSYHHHGNHCNLKQDSYLSFANILLIALPASRSVPWQSFLHTRSQNNVGRVRVAWENWIMCVTPLTPRASYHTWNKRIPSHGLDGPHGHLCPTI